MTRWTKNIGPITVMAYRVVKKPKITKNDTVVTAKEGQV